MLKGLGRADGRILRVTVAEGEVPGQIPGLHMWRRIGLILYLVLPRHRVVVVSVDLTREDAGAMGRMGDDDRN